MDWPLSYRQTQFTPAEVVAITGLTHALQRSWRSQGLLTARTTGHKRFEPVELAEIRIMVVLRSLGLGLQDCREAAEAAAPSVLFLALINQPHLSLGWDAESDRAGRYIDALGWEKDERVSS